MQTVESTYTTHVDAAPERVWQLLAEEFDEIGKWASGVTASVGSGTAPDGASAGERACSIAATGFADTKERIVDWQDRRHLSYELYDGLPGFVTHAENSWTLDPADGGTRLTARTVMQVDGILGRLAAPVMRRNTRKVLASMAEESRHYIETGRPHPDKVRAQAKQARRAKTQTS